MRKTLFEMAIELKEAEREWLPRGTVHALQLMLVMYLETWPKGFRRCRGKLSTAPTEPNQRPSAPSQPSLPFAKPQKGSAASNVLKPMDRFSRDLLVHALQLTLEVAGSSPLPLVIQETNTLSLAPVFTHLSA